jgi:predicted CoA-binding protein
MNDEALMNILTQNHVIAVVGMSPKPERASHRVALYLRDHGYRIIPVNPGFNEILGETCYPDLESIPETEKVDIVDVFRKPDDTPPVAESAVRIGARVLWLQLGIVNEVAASIAESGGLVVVQDRCMKIEHERLIG